MFIDRIYFTFAHDMGSCCVTASVHFSLGHLNVGAKRKKNVRRYHRMKSIVDVVCFRQSLLRKERPPWAPLEYFHRMRSTMPLFAMLVLLACQERRAVDSAAPHAPNLTPTPSIATPMNEAHRRIRVADVTGPVDAMFATATVLYGVSKDRGELFSVALNDSHAQPRIQLLSTSEHAPFAILVFANKLVWATADGVFVSDTDGSGRRTLKSGRLMHALTSSKNGVFFASGDSLWHVEWTPSTQPLAAKKIANDVSADELVALDGSLIWRDRRELWRLNLSSGKVVKLSPDSHRKPHGLSTDGRVVFWHEGEADLLPGREPLGFVAENSNWTIHEAPGEYASWTEFVIRDKYIYGPAQCKALMQEEWIRFNSDDPQTSIGPTPVTDNESRWYWVEALCEDGGSCIRSRIVAADKGACLR